MSCERTTEIVRRTVHTAIGGARGPHVDAARRVIAGDVLAMRAEPGVLRIWAGAGTLHQQGLAAVALAAPGEQAIDDGYGYFYRISTGLFAYVALTAVSPAWQSNPDYVLLFGNVGGRLVGAYRDARQSGLVIETDEDFIDIWTPEVRPLTNRCYRFRFVLESDEATRKEVWRFATAHLAKRTHAGYVDIAAALLAETDKGVVLKQNGLAEAGGSNGNHRIVGDAFLFLDGQARLTVALTDFLGAAGDRTASRLDLGQHTELLDPGVADPNGRVAYASSMHSVFVDGDEAVVRLQADFETVAAISIESLHIGDTQPQWNVFGGGCFDTVYRGPQWWRHQLTGASIGPYLSKDTIVKFEGAGITIDPGGEDATVEGLGATCEIRILPGSDWTDEDRSTLISGTVYGRAEFNWMGRPFAPAAPVGTLLRAVIEWRFGFNGD